MELPSSFLTSEGHLDGNRCVFVIGAPRSGTTWLQRMIESHPDVASVPFELTVFSRYLAPLVKGYELEETALKEGRWRQGLAALYERPEFDEFVRQGIDTVYAKVLSARPEATILLDKHPGYCHHLHLIERYLPGSRFIHIIRDGREVAVSMLSAQKRMGFGADTIQGCAVEWRTSIADARTHGQRIGNERYLEIRYEDLVERTQEGLSDIFTFCGLEASAAWLAEVASNNHISEKAVSRGDPEMQRLRSNSGRSWPTKLDLKQRYLFHRSAGELLIELGYAEARWWALKVTDRLLIAFYPLRVRLSDTYHSLMRIWIRGKKSAQRI